MQVRHARHPALQNTPECRAVLFFVILVLKLYLSQTEEHSKPLHVEAHSFRASSPDIPLVVLNPHGH
jgi:hypothetical protein